MHENIRVLKEIVKRLCYSAEIIFLPINELQLILELLFRIYTRAFCHKNVYHSLQLNCLFSSLKIIFSCFCCTNVYSVPVLTSLKHRSA